MSPSKQARPASSLWPLVDQAQYWVVGFFLFANLVFPLVLYVNGLPTPWRAFNGEKSPITWFSSVQCVMIAMVLLATFLISKAGREVGSDAMPRSWPWFVFFVGFLTMGLDEKFQGHERVREDFLKPREILTDVDWLLPGDIVLIAYVVVGLALSYFLWIELKQDRRSLILFFVAVGLIGFLAIQDALQFDFYKNRTFRHVQTLVEEVGEVWAQLLFALSFILLFFRKLRLFLAKIAEGDTAADPSPES